MSEFQTNNTENQRLEDPEHVSHSVDTVLNFMAERHEIERQLDWLLDRQAQLFEQHRMSRLRGEALESSAGTELDDINGIILETSHVYEKYHPGE